MSSNDLNKALKRVADAFSTLSIPYFIGGSVASSLYGRSRTTADIDVVSSFDLGSVDRFVSMLKDEYFVDSEFIRDAILTKTFFNIVHLETMIKIDIFILKDRAYDQTSLQRAKLDSLNDADKSARFYVASAEDIILAKLEWFRLTDCSSERQWNDILGVLYVQKNRLDLAYLNFWAEQIGVFNLLVKALGEVLPKE